MNRKCAVVLIVACAWGLLVSGIAPAESNWADEISNSLSFYKTNYPGSTWGPYEENLARVRDALSRGDQQTVKVEMSKWFKMLRTRAHGINDVAADELFNFGLMVTPIHEYGISVPAPAGGLSETGY
jgi:hypothetical protein